MKNNQLVTYSSCIEVRDDFVSKNGRVKLLDVAKIVSDCALKVVATMPHEYEIQAKTEEVIISYGIDTEDDSFIKGTRTCVCVTVDRLMPAFPHVREKMLNDGVDDFINNLPKTPFEDAIYQFYQEVGKEISRNVEWSGQMKIKMVHKNYFEYLNLYLGDYGIEPIRTMREYQKFMKD